MVYERALRAYIKFSQSIIQTGLQIGAGFALPDDECAAYLVIACIEFFGITARYYYASGRNTAPSTATAGLC